MSNRKSGWVFPLLWIYIGYLLYDVGLEVYDIAAEVGVTFPPTAKRVYIFFGYVIFAIIAWLVGWFVYWKRDSFKEFRTRLALFDDKLPAWLRWSLTGLLVSFPTLSFLYIPAGILPGSTSFRILIIGGMAFLALLVLYPHTWQKNGLLKFAFLCLAQGVFFTLMKRLVYVHDYPFDLSWTEGNRMWSYSMLFGRWRYILPVDTVFDFYKQLRGQAQWIVWSLIFALPDVSIWWVRLWDAILWIVPAWLLGWVLIPGGGRKNTLIRIIFSLWAFVFLCQGPIYAPPLLCALLVVFAVRRKNLVLTCLLVILATYCADLSRWTWRYAPAVWGGLLALLQIPDPGFSLGRWKQLLRPIIIGAVGFFGGIGMIMLMDRLFLPTTRRVSLLPAMSDLSETGSGQPLIWSRLMPNPTYGPGILFGLVWAVLPLVVLLSFLLIRRVWKAKPLHVAGFSFALLGFLIAGLIVSVKIGGGNNLHNLDMFLITVLIVATFACENILVNSESRKVFLPEKFNLALEASGDLPGNVSSPNGRTGTTKNIAAILVSIVFLAATLYNFQDGNPVQLPPASMVQESLKTIQTEVMDANQEGEVLFIDQRQLLTFGYIQGVPLITDYEKRTLMNQAMASNEKYFQAFHKDLADHRFTLIICEPLRIQYQGDTHHFGQENDAWVNWVSEPVLKYYQPVETMEEIGVQLLIPRME